jgi:hypothetical protein
MVRARKHRENEVKRLQADPEAAANIEREDQQQIPVPSSSTTFPAYFETEMFRKWWRQLVRPVAATSTSIIDNNSSAVSVNHNSINFDALAGSSSYTSNTHEIAPSLHDNQPPLASTLNGGVLSSVSEPWLGAAMDLTDNTNLDTFLGIDMEIDFGDLMNDVNTLNFDWNSWFESVKGDV